MKMGMLPDDNARRRGLLSPQYSIRTARHAEKRLLAAALKPNLFILCLSSVHPLNLTNGVVML